MAVIDGQLKSVPPGIGPIPFNQVTQQFLRLSGALLCDHGKTTMSPQRFELQLGDGAWGITISTEQQLCVTRRHGFKRVLMANQIVGKQEIRYVLDEMAKDPEFDFFCLVDSVDGVARLVEADPRSLPRSPPASFARGVVAIVWPKTNILALARSRRWRFERTLQSVPESRRLT